MSRSLALFHTGAANVDLFDGLLAGCGAGVPVRHMLRPDLLERALAAGRVEDDVRTETRRALAELATAPEVGCVLCTCSTLGPVADAVAGAGGAPVLRVDRPMMARALAAGGRIAVAATFATTLVPTMDLLRTVARELSVAVHARDCLIEGAAEAYGDGDMEHYLELIAAALRRMARHCDVIVLAQASMARALPRGEDISVPVLSSPASGLAAALEVLGVRQRVQTADA